jgi:transcriptional regulator with XRE-family HTH domain
MPASRATASAAQPQQEELVLSKAAVRAADHLGISSTTLAAVLGLSGATVSRLRAGRYTLPHRSKQFELAQLFVRLYRGLDAIMGGDDAASRSWLSAHNLALRGRPADLIQTIPGLFDAVSYVDSRRARL